MDAWLGTSERNGRSDADGKVCENPRPWMGPFATSLSRCHRLWIDATGTGNEIAMRPRGEWACAAAANGIPRSMFGRCASVLQRVGCWCASHGGGGWMVVSGGWDGMMGLIFPQRAAGGRAVGRGQKPTSKPASSSLSKQNPLPHYAPLLPPPLPALPTFGTLAARTSVPSYLKRVTFLTYCP